MKILLRLPKKLFTEDFLQIEVKKKMGVRGDDLFQHISYEEKKKMKPRSKRSIMFSPKMVYICDSVGSNVVLIGTTV